MRQVFGQGHDAQGKEQRSTGIALMHSLGTQDGKTPIGKQGPCPGIASKGVWQEPRAVVCDGLEERSPVCRVEGVLEVQLQEHVVRDRLLQPHADFVD
jgi:hypothetical protein